MLKKYVQCIFVDFKMIISVFIVYTYYICLNLTEFVAVLIHIFFIQIYFPALVAKNTI